MRILVACVALAACTGSGSLKYDREGRVLVAQSTFGGSTGWTASAVFTAGSLWGPEVAKDGPCSSYMGSPSDTSSAGAITITGTDSPITLTPSGAAPNAVYAPVALQSGQIFQADAMITAQAAGSQGATDVAMFTLITTGPTPVAGFSPTTTISRSGFTATWTRGDGPHVWVLLLGDPQTGTGPFILCDADDSGSFTIPASTLALIPANTTAVTLAVGRVDDSSRVLSDTRVELDVVTFTGAGPLALGP